MSRDSPHRICGIEASDYSFLLNCALRLYFEETKSHVSRDLVDYVVDEEEVSEHSDNKEAHISCGCLTAVNCTTVLTVNHGEVNKRLQEEPVKFHFRGAVQVENPSDPGEVETTQNDEIGWIVLEKTTVAGTEDH